MPTKRARRIRAVKAAPRFRVPATILSRVTIWLAGVYGIVQGLSIILTDPIRWGGPSFTTLREMPGAPDSWGWSALAFGTLILLGSFERWWPIKAAGLVLLSSWAFVFAAGILQSVTEQPTAPTTGGPTYILIGVWIAMLTWVDEGRRHEPSP